MSAFQAGSIVVYRVGDGSATLSSSATAVFLDEYSQSGALLQSINLSTSGANPLTASGTATSEGLITDAGNGEVLVTGYDTAAGATSVSSSSVPRVVGIVSADGTVDTNTVLGTFSAGNNIRSAAAVANGSPIFVAGATGAGSTTAEATTTPTSLDTTNTREIQDIGGTLYYSTGSGTAGIYMLPNTTASGQTGTLVPGTSSAQSGVGTSPYDFFFASVAAPNDTLYVADRDKGIEKIVLTGSGASATYTLKGVVAMSGVTGLTGVVSGTTVTLYATSPATLASIVDASGAGGTLTATPTTLATAGPNTAFRGDALAPVCFGSGTLIRTARGDVAVESLAIGDLAVTASGGSCRIRWIGHRTIDCGQHARAHDVAPVRVAAHAFGADLPKRDLFLSPGHPVLVGEGVDEHLVPIMCLINGTTIARTTVESVTYWHVELESHDLLLAEGLPAESYLDWGDRPFFEEAADHVLSDPDFVVPGLGARSRPVALDGEVVERERRRLDSVFAMRLAAQSAWPDAMADVAFDDWGFSG